jgi:hypothetical protein
MLITLGHSVVDIQRRLGHRSADTTLRTYLHQWRLNEAQQSRIGQDLGRLFNSTHDHDVADARRFKLVQQ